jgi:glycerol-3-phosphate acyltransferase PlsY
MLLVYNSSMPGTSMTGLFVDLGLAFFGYLCGSLPFAVWVTRWLKGTDVRLSGSGHATTTNTIRQVGWGAGILVFLMDILKGFVPVYLASTYGSTDWATAIPATLVVAGHCWPLFAGFRGGMGLATSGGAVLALSLLGFLIGVGILIVLVLVIRHSARASVVAGLLIPWIFWLLGMRGEIFVVTLAVGLVVAVRFLIDWNRRYRELWLDRER